MAVEERIYTCDICGQQVKVLKSGMGTLVCCDHPMRMEEE